MTQIFTDELKGFLKDSDLSNYEINAFLTLLKSNPLTAKEISSTSEVPVGRIYEVLDKLKEFGMIEIQDSRPKMYRSMSLNLAFHNLVSHISSKNQRKTAYLFDKAKLLESKLYDSDLLLRKESSKIFWSTSFGVREIFSLYIDNFKDLREELLMTGFINENTIKILQFAKNFYEGIVKALNRGIRVKYLWSFGFDDRVISSEQKFKNKILFERLLDKAKKLFGLSPKMSGLEMKYVHKRIPTYYDIFDKKRVIIKLQDPSDPVRIFSCMNILDPKLAKELMDKFYSLWLFEAEKK